MRRVMGCLALLGLLASCQLALPGRSGGDDPATSGAIVGDPIEVTTLDAPAEGAAPDAAQKKQRPPAAQAKPAEDPTSDFEAEPAQSQTQEPARTNSGEVRPEEQAPVIKSEAWMACEKRGGIWERAAKGSAAFCQMPTKDGGKQCRRSTDCEGYCLARSGTCAPVTPMFGCQEILNEAGRLLTQCIN